MQINRYSIRIDAAEIGTSPNETTLYSAMHCDHNHML